jgi:translation initiation factor IF-2
LDIGDTIYTPSASAKIKSIENHLGQRVEKLSFSSPGITMGWETQPLVGEIFTEQAQTPLSQTPAAQTITPPATNEVPSLIINFVLKADMSGSLEALQLMVEQLLKSLNLSHNIVGQSTGEIVLGDLKLAENTNAIIVAFNSKMTLEAKGYYKPERITFFEGKIIYHLIESLKAHLEKSLNPNPENIVARQNIIAVFTEPDKKKCQIVGGPLYEGSLKPPMKCSVIRNNEKIGSGRLLSIRKNKQEMESCDAPGEYGVQIELREENLAIQTGDRLEFSPGQKK